MSSVPKSMFATRVLLIVGLSLLAVSASGQILYPKLGACDPADDESGVAREQGRLGIVYQFQFFFDGETPLPITDGIDLSTATIAMEVNGAPVSSDGATINPSSGNIGYEAIDNSPCDGHKDALRILYNGDFPVNAHVEVTVTGAQAVVTHDGVPYSLTQDAASPGTLVFDIGSADPRPPFSGELVFDISGSMGWPVETDGSVSRLDVLKAAARSLYDVGSSCPSGFLADNAMLGDELGLVYFSTTATAFPSAPNLQAAHDDDVLHSLFNNIEGQVATNATSIGAGLETAASSGLAHAASGNVMSVLLFSDGEQNRDPEVDVSGSAVKVGGSDYMANVKIYTITAGIETAPGLSLQQMIATNTGGDYARLDEADMATVSSTLETLFLQWISDMASGDKVEIARDTTGIINPGENQRHTFLVNPNDVSLTLMLSWSTIPYKPSRQLLPIRLTAPDGSELDAARFVRYSRSRAYVRLPFPLMIEATTIDPVGEWTVELMGEQMQGHRLAYHLLVLPDNSTIASEFWLGESGDVGTGIPIPIHVRLTDNGAPVSGARVYADLMGPKEGLGDILSDNPSPSGDPGPVADSFQTLAQRNLYLLSRDPAMAEKFSLKPMPDVILRDDGNAATGDAAPNDGIYSGLTPPIEEEGHVQYKVKVRASSPENGEYERSRRLSIFVRPKPVAELTTFSVLSEQVRNDGSKSIRIGVEPKDAYGNRIGPDYLPGNLTFACGECTDSSRLTDNLNGTYAITYVVPPGVDNPTFSLTVMDEPVQAIDLKSIRGSFYRWTASLHGGYTTPTGMLSNSFDGSVTVAVDLEYRATRRFSGEIVGGHDRFTGKGGADDFYFSRLTGHAKYIVLPGVIRPILSIGAGGYFGKDTDAFFGWNGGVAIEYWNWSRIAVGAAYSFHSIDGGNFEYNIVTAGVRYAFD